MLLAPNRLTALLLATTISLYAFSAVAGSSSKNTTTTKVASVATVNSVSSKAATTSRAGGSFYTSNTKNVAVNGDRNLYSGKVGDVVHDHAVIDSKGIPQYIRQNGKVLVEDTRVVGRAIVNGAEVAVRKAAPIVKNGAKTGAVLAEEVLYMML